MSFLKRFFGTAVEAAQEYDAIVASCQFESSNNDCSLVQQLKDKQAQKRVIEQEIHDYKVSSPFAVPNLYEFLKKLEHYGPRMGGRSWLEYDMNSIGMVVIERALCDMTEESVEGIGTELRAIRNRRRVISEKETVLVGICAEITVLKSKLGIE